MNRPELHLGGESVGEVLEDDVDLEAADKPKLTEQQARDWLATHDKQSVRELAAAWGWHRSSVQRFLARSGLPPESGGRQHSNGETARDTPRETLPVVSPQQDDDEWKWHDNDAILIREQPAIAVYWNPHGEIVIRRECWPDEDAFV